MGLIELVRGMATSDETFEASQRLAGHLGKTTCVSLVRGSPPLLCGLSVSLQLRTAAPLQRRRLCSCVPPSRHTAAI